MTPNGSGLLHLAIERLGSNAKPMLDGLNQFGATNLEWYLSEKILKAPDGEQLKDNRRVLKYANNFCLNHAKVTFVKESSSRNTPDLMVDVGQHRFYVEVKKFRLLENSVAAHRVSKIVGSVSEKRKQLPSDEVGLVAIDNFDLGLESEDGAGFTHDHIVNALCEIERLATENPEGWRKPSGVIVAAHTSGGALSGVADNFGIPHFVWINAQSAVPLPDALTGWIRSSLPGGAIFDAGGMCSQVTLNEQE